MGHEGLAIPVREPLILPTNHDVRLYARVELTRSQKDWVRDRDDYQCQHPDADHYCVGDLQVHHIIGELYSQAFLGLTADFFNTPENLLLLCENVHQGTLQLPEEPSLIHPDSLHARQAYINGDREAFRKIGEHHREEVIKGHKPWNTVFDDEMGLSAIWRTRQVEKKYQEYRFPEGRRHK